MTTDYEGRTGTVLLIPSSVTRSGVERGDPLAVLTAGGSRSSHGVFHWPERAAGADEAEPDPSQTVAADPQPFDTQTDGVYGDAVLHGIKSDGRTERAGEAATRAAHDAAPPPTFDRLRWLARVQRIDPRERKP